jgi:putative hemolysin
LDNLVVEILIIFILLLANGLFAMSEIAIVAARKVRLQQWADEDNKRARAALELVEAPTQFLSTVQVGITLIGILAGAFGGATLAEELAAYLERFPGLAHYSEAIGVGVVVVLITYFSLIIGELVPKRVALINAERIALLIARPMRLLARITAPIVWFISASTEFIIRLLGISATGEPGLTEDEIKVLIEQGTQEGVFEESEQDMIEGVLRLGERPVGILMTPRTQITWLDLADPPEQIKHELMVQRHSIFPVGRDNLDNLLGIVHTKDLLAQLLADQPFDLKTLLKQPLFVPEKMLALQALDLLKQKGAKVAFVVDEYGSIEGMVTPDDFLEDIVGDLAPPEGREELKAIRRPDGSWLLDGLLHIDELKEILEIDELPEENEGFYQTLGGFVIHQLGSIPTAGEWFEWKQFRFEVVDMDARRVDKVLAAVKPVELPDTAEET